MTKKIINYLKNFDNIISSLQEKAKINKYFRTRSKITWEVQKRVQCYFGRICIISNLEVNFNDSEPNGWFLIIITIKLLMKRFMFIPITK